MNDLTRETLIGTRSLLTTRGWIQGLSHTAKGSCISGACHEASRPSTGQYNRAMAALYGSLPTPYRDGWLLEPWEAECDPGACAGAVISYNDTAGRTEEEILDLIDRALEKMKPSTRQTLEAG